MGSVSGWNCGGGPGGDGGECERHKWRSGLVVVWWLVLLVVVVVVVVGGSGGGVVVVSVSFTPCAKFQPQQNVHLNVSRGSLKAIALERVLLETARESERSGRRREGETGWGRGGTRRSSAAIDRPRIQLEITIPGFGSICLASLSTSPSPNHPAHRLPATPPPRAPPPPSSRPPALPLHTVAASAPPQLPPLAARPNGEAVGREPRQRFAHISERKTSKAGGYWAAAAAAAAPVELGAREMSWELGGTHAAPAPGGWNKGGAECKKKRASFDAPPVHTSPEPGALPASAASAAAAAFPRDGAFRVNSLAEDAARFVEFQSVPVNVFSEFSLSF
ncbi:Protein of unknown function [Gryllus bimaculatus]|nr:Protein of unknown function [Gryllus bimaculatus]